MCEQPLWNQAERDWRLREIAGACSECGEQVDRYGDCDCGEDERATDGLGEGDASTPLPLLSIGPSGIGGYCQKELQKEL